MSKHGPSLPAAGLAAILVVLATTGAGIAAPADPFPSRAVLAPSPGSMQLAQAEGAESGEMQPRELQPRYEPVEPRPKSSYNDEYIFGLTRGIADSAMHPAAKVLLFPLTVPLDLAFLPFSAIGGLF